MTKTEQATEAYRKAVLAERDAQLHRAETRAAKTRADEADARAMARHHDAENEKWERAKDLAAAILADAKA